MCCLERVFGLSGLVDWGASTLQANPTSAPITPSIIPLHQACMARDDMARDDMAKDDMAGMTWQGMTWQELAARRQWLATKHLYFSQSNKTA